ncbi:hypothetical protein [Embleya scabrispora]|uniref:hypothetical protein n=1 Tax=Embleya scabrispora TaxID=159449 RepID=UPI00037989CC|nr:hypothetical protein [Embleya scabrispora]MYS81347.1 hypothetical protein [Streptomyces sp. SID5474]
MKPDRIDWGNALTAAGAVFAATAAWATLRTLQKQRQQLDEQRSVMAEQTRVLRLQQDQLLAYARDRTDQARRITVDSKFTDVPGHPNTDGNGSRTVTVTNPTDYPIRGVRVDFGGDPEWATIQLEGQYGATRSKYPIDVLAPRGVAVFYSGVWPANDIFYNPPQVTFTDSLGQQWKMNETGQLWLVTG